MSGADTRANRNRKVRQDALRDQLSKQKHVEEVIEIAKELGKSTTEPKDVTRLKVKADLHLALIKKYIPDLKQMELTGDEENPLSVNNKWTIEYVSPKDS